MQPRHDPVVVTEVHGKRRADLPQIVGAPGPLARIPRVRERRQQQRRQNRDDGDNDKKLDESEGVGAEG
jgi:hypothetical protein